MTVYEQRGCGPGDLDPVEQQLELIIDVHAAFANVENLLGPDRVAMEPRFQDLFHRLRLASRS